MKKKYSFQKYINEYGSERTYLAENTISEPLVRLETLYRDKISTILENLDDKHNRPNSRTEMRNFTTFLNGGNID